MDELSEVRGMMLGAAEKLELPGRFQVVGMESSPSLLFTDTETGRTSVVSLCDYYGARKLLADLFGERDG